MSLDNTSATNNTIEELLHQFFNTSLRKRRSLLKSLESRSEELSLLGPDVFNDYDPDGDDWAVGCILQIVKRNHPERISNIISSKNLGWFNCPSSIDQDYGELQKYLLEERFEDADRFTSATLRKLAGNPAEERGYVYFSEVKDMPETDLNTIDRLWFAYSLGKFSFSVQSILLSYLNGRYEALWPRIGWKKDGIWTRYPNSFTWSLDAPEGHMPLVNQLRGVRLMDALLNHPALIARAKLVKTYK